MYHWIIFILLIQNQKYFIDADGDCMCNRAPVNIHTSNSGRMIRELVKVAALWPPAVWCGVDGEEEGRKDSSLRNPSVADHTVWHIVLHILWSASQVVYDPGFLHLSLKPPKLFSSSSCNCEAFSQRWMFAFPSITFYWFHLYIRFHLYAPHFKRGIHQNK